MSAAALQRIEDAATLPADTSEPTQYNRRRVQAALQRMANRAIHRAFDHRANHRDVARVRAWAGKTTKTARANRAKAADSVRGVGDWDLSRNPQTESKWLAHHGESKPRGRGEEPFHAELTHGLAVCFHVLFREFRVNAAARFAAAFYKEVGKAITRANIADPQGRGRERHWREPDNDAMRKRLRPIVRSQAWRDWSITEAGEIVFGRYTPPPSDWRPDWKRPRLADVLATLSPEEQERHLAALAALETEDERASYIASLPRASESAI